MGTHIVAGKGSGKSRLMGRIIAFLDFLQGVPTVIFDPHGGTIDNFLDRMLRLPRIYQERFWERVEYIDMSGHWGYVTPMPFYNRFQGESFYDVSQRYLDVVYKLDSYLQTASIQGWNPLWLTGTMAGMVLSALGMQITEAQDLILNPELWKDKLYSIRNLYPELIPAISFLLSLSDLRSNEYDRFTSSIRNKLAQFSTDPTLKAMFGANSGLDLDDLIKARKIFLLDFRYVKGRVRRQFLMEWAFQYFLSYLKHRGPGRHLPISLVIDELTALFSVQGEEPRLFIADLDDLINVLSRQYSLWLTICHQEHFQLPEVVNKSLMSLGNQIIGVTREREASKELAEYFYRYDPHLVRKYEPIWMNDMGRPFIVDYRSVEFTHEEQLLRNSYRFTDLKRFEFLFSPALGEGSVSTELQKVSIDWFDRGLYTQDDVLEDAREKLVKRSGQPVEKIIAEVDRRKPRLLPKKTQDGGTEEFPSAEVRKK